MTITGLRQLIRECIVEEALDKEKGLALIKFMKDTYNMDYVDFTPDKRPGQAHLGTYNFKRDDGRMFFYTREDLRNMGAPTATGKKAYVPYDVKHPYYSKSGIANRRKPQEEYVILDDKEKPKTQLEKSQKECKDFQPGMVRRNFWNFGVITKDPGRGINKWNPPKS